MVKTKIKTIRKSHVRAKYNNNNRNDGVYDDVAFDEIWLRVVPGGNVINLRLISDYRDEDKDFSPEPWTARVNTRVECQCPSPATCIISSYIVQRTGTPQRFSRSFKRQSHSTKISQTSQWKERTHNAYCLIKRA